jgi:hypothetical protein
MKVGDKEIIEEIYRLKQNILSDLPTIEFFTARRAYPDMDNSDKRF